MKYLLILITVINSIIVVNAQIEQSGSRTNTQSTQQSEEGWRQMQEQLVEQSLTNLRNLQGSKKPEDNYLNEPKFTKEQKLLLIPSKVDIEKYSDLLKINNTDIFKIFSVPNCGNRQIVDVRNENCIDKDKISMSYYSFRTKKYGLLNWADLAFEDNSLIVGFEPLTIGLIRVSENVSIENITKDSSEINDLISFEMPTKYEDVSKKKLEIKNGINIGGRRFAHNSIAKLNQIYLLRTYAYRYNNSANNDSRIDLTVAFKIVSKDEKNGITVIWKEIEKKKTQKLEL